MLLQHIANRAQRVVEPHRVRIVGQPRPHGGVVVRPSLGKFTGPLGRRGNRMGIDAVE